MAKPSAIQAFLSAIISKLHEKACNCLLIIMALKEQGPRSKLGKDRAVIFAHEHYSAKFCVTNGYSG